MIDDDLSTWLRAQLDEDERVALAAAGCYGGDAVWRRGTLVDPDYGADEFLHIHDRTLAAGLPGDDEDPLRVAELDHMARHDPARVLADVDAKRRILGVIDRMYAEPGAGDSLVRLLALHYAGQPGYRDEWRP